MKKFSFLIFTLFLFGINLSKAQEFGQDLTVEILPGSGCPFELAPGTYVRATFDGGSNCPSGGVSLSFDRSHFGFVPANGQNITIEPENTRYYWTSITGISTQNLPYPNAPIGEVMDPILVTGTHTIYPNEGAVEMTLHFDVAYKDENGTDLTCPINVKVKGLNYNCFCNHIPEASVIVTNFSCDFDDCTGLPRFDYTVSLSFTPSAPAPSNIFVAWYLNGQLNQSGTGLVTAQLNDLVGSNFSVLAKITYFGACGYQTQPIWLQTDGFPVGTCTGVSGPRVMVKTTLQGCIQTPQGVRCHYLLEAVPALTDPVVVVNTAQWSINGTNLGSGLSINYTTEPGVSLTTVLLNATGTVNNVSCNWQQIKGYLPCGTNQCGSTCSFLNDVSINKKLLGCDMNGCEGCSYQLSLFDPTTPNIEDYVVQIIWTVNGVNYTGLNPVVCVNNISQAAINADITFVLGCHKYINDRLFCDDYECGDCNMNTQLSCLGIFNSQCRFKIEASGCAVLNTVNHRYTYTFDAYEGSNNPIHLGPGPFNGTFNYIFNVPPGHVYNIVLVVYFNGVAIETYTGTASCTNGCSVEEGRPGERSSDNGKPAQNDKPNILIHPNPTSSDMTVTVSENIGSGATMYLFDVDGRLRMEKPLPSTPGEFKFDVSELPEGIYLVKIKSDTTELKVQKLSIARN